MLLFDRNSWQLHRRWFWSCAAITAAVGLAYTACCVGSSRLLGGGSLLGLITGGAAALLIVLCCAFGARKWRLVRAWFELRPAKARLRQHVWLGLLSVPLVLVHSRLFHFGAVLSTALLVVFLVVIASGIWGLFLQQWLPRRLLHDAAGETIPSQIPALAEQLARDAQLLVLATCGPPPNGHGAGLPAALRDNVGRVRAARAGCATALLAQLPTVPVAGAEGLREYFTDAIDPFLRHSGSVSSPLRTRHQATVAFEDLRSKLPPDAHAVVDVLEELCSQCRQLDRQARIHFWLHSWLLVHLPLSACLLVLLVWHAVTSVIYW